MIISEIKNTSPVDAFLAIRRQPMAFILTGWSFDGKKKFSYVGAAPSRVIKCAEGLTSVRKGGESLFTTEADPFTVIAALLEEGSKKTPPFPFSGGAFGYFSYDLKEMLEPRRLNRTNKTPEMPQSIVGIYDPIFVFDHSANAGCIVSVDDNETGVGEMREMIAGAALKAKWKDLVSRDDRTTQLTSNISREKYIESIGRAKDYIRSGDIYQINLSQRLEFKVEEDPFLLYLRLVEASPAPFSSFFDLGDFQIISNSPERLLKVDGNEVLTEPIKGTRPRGKTPQEDRALIEELKSSPKELAEHVMIVDLERNDIGRISMPGTVAVDEFEEIVTYPHLHHMVSKVKGRLKEGISALSALRSFFPGGSVTGAPKIRAMEIIEEIEGVARGIYTGGIGWMDGGGNMDIAMAIRTAVYKSGTLSLHVGGGIVADSVPEEEYEETLIKAETYMRILGNNRKAGLLNE